MLLNIISATKAGGAELLVRNLHKLYKGKGQQLRTIYFSGCVDDLDSDELVIGVNPRSPLNIFRLRTIFKKYKASSQCNLLVHVHLTWPFFYTVLASLGLKGITLVYTEHSTYNKRRHIPFFKYIERIFYNRYQRIVCISEGVQASLVPWVGVKLSKRLVTISNGSRIYTLIQRPSLHGRKPRLLSVGSLTAKKNYETVIGAVAHLQDEIESYTLIGEGPERDTIKRLITLYGLEDKVIMTGWSDAIEAHLHSADIQVIPSHWEGFGLAAVEGMSTGLPVVASNVDGLREVLGVDNPAVTLVNQVASVPAWVAAIRSSIRILNTASPELISTSARQQAEKFTLDSMVENYLQVYRDI